MAVFGSGEWNETGLIGGRRTDPASWVEQLTPLGLANSPIASGNSPPYRVQRLAADIIDSLARAEREGGLHERIR